MKGKLCLFLALAVFAGLSGAAKATPLGCSTDPAGAAWDRGDTNTGFAVYDSFPTFTYANDGPDSAGGFTSTLLGQSNTLTGVAMTDQGAGAYDNVTTIVVGTDVLLTGGRGANFTATIDAPFPIKQFFLQIKRASTTSDLSTLAPTLGGIAPNSFSSINGTGDTTSGSGSYSVTTFYWGANLFSQTLTNPVSLLITVPNQRAIDGMSFDASTVAVPEPVSLALLPVAGLVTGRRRKV